MSTSTNLLRQKYFQNVIYDASNLLDQQEFKV